MFIAILWNKPVWHKHLPRTPPEHHHDRHQKPVLFWIIHFSLAITVLSAEPFICFYICKKTFFSPSTSAYLYIITTHLTRLGVLAIFWPTEECCTILKIADRPEKKRSWPSRSHGPLFGRNRPPKVAIFMREPILLVLVVLPLYLGNSRSYRDGLYHFGNGMTSPDASPMEVATPSGSILVPPILETAYLSHFNSYIVNIKVIFTALN